MSGLLSGQNILRIVSSDLARHKLAKLFAPPHLLLPYSGSPLVVDVFEPTPARPEGRPQKSLLRCSAARFYRRIQSRMNSGTLDHDIQCTDAGTARQDRCLLARCQLSIGRPDLSLRQSAAEAAAGARGCEAPFAGTLGHDSGSELHLRALEPDHQEIRPRHDLCLRPRARR